MTDYAKQQRTRRGTPLWLPRGGAGHARRTCAPRLTRWIPPTRWRVFRAWRVMSGGLMRSAYPAPHRGSHKGVPLRCAFGVPRGDWRQGAFGVTQSHIPNHRSADY